MKAPFKAGPKSEMLCWETNTSLDVPGVFLLFSQFPKRSTDRAPKLYIYIEVTLAEFMESFNDLVKNATTADAEFYGLRGTRVHRVEVTGYTCADKRTEQTLQEVNQETTNKINRIRKQEPC